MSAQVNRPPRKIGMAPIQREGFEYEADLFCELNLEHDLLVQKSRCPALTDKVIARPDRKVAEIIKNWLAGAPAPAQPPAPAPTPVGAPVEQPAARTESLAQASAPVITTSTKPATKSHKLNQIFSDGKKKNLWVDTISFLQQATSWVEVDLIAIEDARALSDEQIEQMSRHVEEAEAREPAEPATF
jgi:hypothetical protein